MHPLHHALHNELHSRPSIYFDAPAWVYHFALLDEQQHSEHWLATLCAQLQQPYQPSQVQGFLAWQGYLAKWERHTEFVTFTLVCPREDEQQEWPAAPAWLQPWLDSHRQQIINACLIRVEHESQWRGSPQAYGFKDPAGSYIGGEDARLWSDFRLLPSGLTPFLLLNRHLNAYRLGRMLRRVLEIETYRMMASLALPMARQQSQQLKHYEQQLTALSARNAELNPAQDKALLRDLSELSAELNHCAQTSSQRFSATEAYARLVFERITELRESRIGECQRLGVFIERRFKPSVRYCHATAQRLLRLQQQVADLSDLLRTRIQLEVEEQNSAILHSLNRHAASQIRIQKAVEGFSIIAISYYLLSLFKLGLEGLHSLGLDVDASTATTILAPLALLVLGGLLWSKHRLPD
ncbi:DUF3422 domain-containing protein [Balneatrix alpica]|uniref:DUF3422 domain-containing protein n=1 Tax=Balneatrix alpica TaxID=75684 RepID=UPI002738DA6A|nr:DUF3422 domain-containing protein [Balneatrix alpica]